MRAALQRLVFALASLGLLLSALYYALVVRDYAHAAFDMCVLILVERREQEDA